MIITYHGLEFVKVQFGDKILAFNPISKDSKAKPTRFGADVALISFNNEDMNGVDQLSFGDRQPFIISGPGEYEVKEVFIKGFPSVSGYGKDAGISTIYSVSLEGMNICHMGPIKSGVSIPPNLQEELDGIDVLFVPIGGDGIITASEAYKIAVKLEPKIVIPIHYSENDKSALKTFLKEAGEDAKPIDKFTFKKKDLEGKEVEVVVLSLS